MAALSYSRSRSTLFESAILDAGWRFLPPTSKGLTRRWKWSSPRARTSSITTSKTVPRLYRTVRLGARYPRSLDMLLHAKRVAPDIPTKSGMMLGLGESRAEVIAVMRDLRAHQVDIFTLGQYLRPSQKHLPIQRYYSPQEFAHFKRLGYEMGFRHVEAGPLVRSSYHADEAGGEIAG